MLAFWEGQFLGATLAWGNACILKSTSCCEVLAFWTGLAAVGVGFLEVLAF